MYGSKTVTYNLSLPLCVYLCESGLRAFFILPSMPHNAVYCIHAYWCSLLSVPTYVRTYVFVCLSVFLSLCVRVCLCVYECMSVFVVTVAYNQSIPIQL